MKNKEPIVIEEPIHEFFELSYASYLVLPRSVLQSMPVKWQKQFVKLMNEAEELIGEYPREGLHYDVFLRNALGQRVEDPLRDYERGRRRLPYKQNKDI
jgi:hypothetical protein